MCPLLCAEQETPIQPHHRSEGGLRRKASNQIDQRNVLGTLKETLEEITMEPSESSVTEVPCLGS